MAYKSPYAQTDGEKLKSAVKLVKDGILSLYGASKITGIPRSKILRYFQQSINEEKNRENELQQQEPEIFTENEENKLLSKINDYASKHRDFSLKNVQKFAYCFAKQRNIEYPASWDEEEMASASWLQMFCNRHDDHILLRNPDIYARIASPISIATPTSTPPSTPPVSPLIITSRSPTPPSLSRSPTPPSPPKSPILLSLSRSPTPPSPPKSSTPPPPRSPTSLPRSSTPPPRLPTSPPKSSIPPPRSPVPPPRSSTPPPRSPTPPPKSPTSPPRLSTSPPKSPIPPSRLSTPSPTTFRNLKTALDNCSSTVLPTNIWNISEIILHNPPRVSINQSKKPVSAISYDESNNFTVISAVNAGGDTIPPMMIFPNVDFKDFVLDGAPPGTIGAMNSSGGLNEDLFLEFFRHFLRYAKPSKDLPCFVLLDDRESHMCLPVYELAKEKEVTLIIFRPEVCHKTQPIDESVAAAFKSSYNKAARELLYTPYYARRILRTCDVATIVGKAFPKAFSQKNITQGFRVTGFYPLNEHKQTQKNHENNKHKSHEHKSYKSKNHEPKSHQLKSHESKSHEPKKHELKNHEPKNHEPKNHEPKSHELKSHEPKKHELKSYKSKDHEPKSHEPKSHELKSHEPKSHKFKSDELKNLEPKSHEPKSHEFKYHEHSSSHSSTFNNYQSVMDHSVYDYDSSTTDVDDSHSSYFRRPSLLETSNSLQSTSSFPKITKVKRHRTNTRKIFIANRKKSQALANTLGKSIIGKLCNYKPVTGEGLVLHKIQSYVRARTDHKQYTSTPKKMIVISDSSDETVYYSSSDSED